MRRRFPAALRLELCHDVLDFLGTGRGSTSTASGVVTNMRSVNAEAALLSGTARIVPFAKTLDGLFQLVRSLGELLESGCEYRRYPVSRFSALVDFMLQITGAGRTADARALIGSRCAP